MGLPTIIRADIPLPVYSATRVDNTITITRIGCCDSSFTLGGGIEQMSFKADFPPGAYGILWIDQYPNPSLSYGTTKANIINCLSGYFGEYGTTFL